MKKCSQCSSVKPTEDFYVVKSIVSAVCKECHKKSINNYRRTKDGVATSIYNTQCANSVKRGHSKPSYNKDEFKNWLFNHKKFDKLYSDWIESGYKKNFKPSPDRIDNNKGYSFNNLRLVTCLENIRGKRKTFNKKDLSLLYPRLFNIKGFEDYYITHNSLLINSKTNRKIKRVVRGHSIGYNLGGSFCTLSKFMKLLVKANNSSKNNVFIKSEPKKLDITCRFKIYDNVVCGVDHNLYQLSHFKGLKYIEFKKLKYNEYRNAYRINSVWVTRKRLLNLRIEKKETLKLNEDLLSNNFFI